MICIIFYGGKFIKYLREDRLLKFFILIWDYNRQLFGQMVIFWLPIGSPIIDNDGNIYICTRAAQAHPVSKVYSSTLLCIGANGTLNWEKELLYGSWYEPVISISGNIYLCLYDNHLQRNRISFWRFRRMEKLYGVLIRLRSWLLLCLQLIKKAISISICQEIWQGGFFHWIVMVIYGGKPRWAVLPHPRLPLSEAMELFISSQDHPHPKDVYSREMNINWQLHAIGDLKNSKKYQPWDWYFFCPTESFSFVVKLS